MSSPTVTTRSMARDDGYNKEVMDQDEIRFARGVDALNLWLYYLGQFVVLLGSYDWASHDMRLWWAIAGAVALTVIFFWPFELLKRLMHRPWLKRTIINLTRRV